MRPFSLRLDLADPRPGDLVVDLGAYKGALATAIAARGARRVDALRSAARETPLVEVVQADSSQVALLAEPFRVLASPPSTCPPSCCDVC